MLSAGRTSVCVVVRSVSERHRVVQSIRICCTHGDANQDHLDVAEHLRDAEDNVKNDGHELRETGVVRPSEPIRMKKRRIVHLPAGRRYKVVFFRLSNTNRPAWVRKRSDPKKTTGNRETRRTIFQRDDDGRKVLEEHHVGRLARDV